MVSISMCAQYSFAEHRDVATATLLETRIDQASTGFKPAASQSSQVCALRLLLPKALQVLRHLTRQRQVLGIEAFDLLDARASVLGEVEDVDLAV